MANSKADALNDYFFKSVFTTEDLSSMPIMPDSLHPNMQDIDITASGVHALLSKINPQKVAGPDDIPAQVLKETAYVITPMLTHLLNNLWRQGDTPGLEISTCVCSTQERNKL